MRQHGWNKRRTWRKLHLGVNEATGEIIAQTLTPASQDDASQVEPLLGQVQAPVKALGGDGAYDKRKVFDRLAAPEQEPPIQPIIPPRKDAKIQQHGNTKAEPLPRDQTIRAIRQQGRQAWKKTSGYHRRSIAETQMARYKRSIGNTLYARRLANQPTEAQTKLCPAQSATTSGKTRVLPRRKKCLNQRKKESTIPNRFMQQSLFATKTTALLNHSRWFILCFIACI